MNDALTTLGREAEAEFEEKKSVFIAHVCPVSDEAAAQDYIRRKKAEFADARHNVWGYRMAGDIIVRCSDDGEPQGSAGIPTLDVLRKSGVSNAVIVTTRYFGGILLGAGGLVRAYAHGAKIAVDAAGRSIKRIWTNVYLPCPYSWYERIRLEVAAFGGMIRETQFGADVELDLLLPEEQTQGFLERVTDLSAGTIEGLIGKQEYRAFPLS